MKPTLDGLLVIDKPGGITSRDAVDRALGWFPRGTRMGHTGTLDPLATGVLVLCLGRATRLAEYVQKMSKTYRATVMLGARSDTDDADGKVTPNHDAPVPDQTAIAARIAEFIGEISQVPPAYSAAKVAGRRAYDLARRGAEVELAARTVHIYQIDLLRYAYPELELEVVCGKGTYIRSLARDLGERLGCGAYLTQLRRSRVGPFYAAEGAALADDTSTAVAKLRPMKYAVADLPSLTLPQADLARLKAGQALPWTDHKINGELAIFDAAGNLMLIARTDYKRGVLTPDKVLQRE